METGTRTHHPFHMHDAILAQPEAFARTVGHNGEAADGLVADLGAPCPIVGDSAAGAPEGTRSVTVPSVPEPFSALTCGLPLQLFAYGPALSRGTNPDSFRTDDPRFPNVSEGVRL